RPPIEPEDRLPPAPHSSGAPPAENLAGRLAGLGLKKALQICFEIALQIRPARRKLQPYPTEGREMVERKLEMMLELLPEPRELVASECVRNDRHYAPVVVPHQLFDVLLHKGLRQIAVDLERGMAAGGCGALENFGLPGPVIRMDGDRAGFGADTANLSMDGVKGVDRVLSPFEPAPEPAKEDRRRIGGLLGLAAPEEERNVAAENLVRRGASGGGEPFRIEVHYRWRVPRGTKHLAEIRQGEQLGLIEDESRPAAFDAPPAVDIEKVRMMHAESLLQIGSRAGHLEVAGVAAGGPDLRQCLQNRLRAIWIAGGDDEHMARCRGQQVEGW